MSAKPKDHTKTIQSIKKTVGELRKSVNTVSKGHEKMAPEKHTQSSPEDHKAALNHFASQYKMAKINGQEDKASDYAKSYHVYAAKMDKHFHSKLKESADFCPECQEDPCVCGGNHLDGDKVQEAMKPGWMLKADPELAKKVKDKQDLHKKRVASYGNQSAGKSVSKVKLDELSKSTLKSYVDKVATGPSRGKTQSGLLKSIKAITGVSKAIRKQHEGSNVKEEVEQVNELKTSTLSSYLEKKHKKATDLPVQTYDRQKGMIHKDPKTGEQMSADKAGSKVAKHLSNIAKAQDKIRKNVNKNVKPSNNDYSSSIQKDYEKNKGRYQGD